MSTLQQRLMYLHAIVLFWHLQVDPAQLRRLHDRKNVLPFDAYLSNNSTWRRVGGSGVKDSALTCAAHNYVDIIERTLQNGHHLGIADFDEHLDDIKR